MPLVFSAPAGARWVICLSLSLALPGLPWSGESRAAAHGLVVGIDQYQYGALNARPGQLSHLQGAVNDATRLVTALRQIHVDVPESRVLLNERATRTGVITAWNAMVEQSQTGDLLVFAFSGHGGQEPEQPGIGVADETDGHDETLLLYDFNPNQPLQGRLSDDELSGWFQQLESEIESQQRQILFVADTCHAAGLDRNLVRRGHSRSSGPWPLVSGAAPPLDEVPVAREDTPRPYVTHLLANDNEALEIQELVIDGQWHGALSYALTEALDGGADLVDHDGWITRRELSAYLYERVRSHTEHAQTPRILPDAAAVPLLALGEPEQAPPAIDSIPVMVTAGISIPSGLTGVAWVDEGGLLNIEPSPVAGQVRVRNRVGDRLTDRLPASDPSAWQRVIDSARLQQAIVAHNSTHSPVTIVLKEGDRTHPPGQRLHFRIEPPRSPVSPQQPLSQSLTLFNLSGNGALQTLYPLAAHQDPLRVSLPYPLPPLRVIPPLGGETLVAVLCAHPPPALHRLLSDAERSAKIPSPEALFDAMSTFDCHIGRYPWFSADPDDPETP